VFVVVTPTTHQLDLKAIEGETPTRNFVIKPQSVVQVKQGDNLVVATQPITQIVESVKIQDQKGVIKELESLGNNVYSLAGIPVGNYILDVIVDLGSNKRGAYETILVILAQGQQPVNPTQIINQVKQITDVQIIFEDDNNDNDRDPCKKYVKICRPILDNGQCEQGYAKLFGACFDTDAILDHDTEEECQADPLCREYRDRYPSDPLPLPYCGETPVKEGELCRDPGDDITCDGPEIPIGNSCQLPPTPEPIEEIPDVPEEDNDSGNEDNDSVDNGDSGNDNGNGDSGDSGNGNSDNGGGDSGSGEFFD
jgi:uncharacterized membrane protein YgcG